MKNQEEKSVILKLTPKESDLLLASVGFSVEEKFARLLEDLEGGRDTDSHEIHVTDERYLEYLDYVNLRSSVETAKYNTIFSPYREAAK